MNNALTVSRRGFGLGAAAFGLLLVSGCSRGSSSEGGGLGSGSGKLTLAYNSDGPHKTWAEAVCHSVSNVLGITMEPLPVAQFSEMRTAITDHSLLGVFRSGWSADYPSLENFLNATLISEKLRAEGLPLARRTVAKYREQLNLPVARLRKEL